LCKVSSLSIQEIIIKCLSDISAHGKTKENCFASPAVAAVITALVFSKDYSFRVYIVANSGAVPWNPPHLIIKVAVFFTGNCVP
jgi:hypothetical protein